MLKDITIINFTGVDAPTYRVRYARVDNTTTPVMQVAGTPTPAQFPFTIAAVDNGQYDVGITPVYPDERACTEIVQRTNSCQGIIALNAVREAANLKITYTAAAGVPQVYLTVIYPNGGSFTGAYTNGANDSTILVPIPTGVNGDYSVYMQSICDPDTGFYSTPTPPVTVTVGTNTVEVTNTAPVTVITLVNGISGYSLSAPVAAGDRVTGIHGNFTGAITVTFTGTPSITSKGTLTVNGTLQQCVALPNTAGGTIAFTSATYYSTDSISIGFSTGNC